MGRIGLGQPSHAARELGPERIVRTKPARLHLPHDEHRQRTDDDRTRRDSVGERGHLARRDALVADARSSLLLGREDALRVGDYV